MSLDSAAAGAFRAEFGPAQIARWLTVVTFVG